jgi:suppressor for copper-sensitivity B
MRKLPNFGRAIGFAILVTLLGVLGSAARADAPQKASPVSLNALLGNSQQGIPTSASEQEKPIVRVALTPKSAKTGSVVTLSITVSLPPGAYTYSTNKGGPGATKIELNDIVGLAPQAGSEFEADREPIVLTDPVSGNPIEKFERVVTWLCPYVMTADNPEAVQIAGTISLKYCDSKSCQAFTHPIRARLVADASGDDSKADAGNDKSDSFTKTVAPRGFGGRPGPAELTFELSPRNPKPGDTVTLGITMKLDEHWHTYSTTQVDAPGSTTTKITLDKGRALRPIGDAFRADHEPTVKTGPDTIGPQEQFEGKVTWTRRFKFEPKAGETGFGIDGKIHYGICNESTCLPPHTEEFKLGDLNGAGPLPKALPDDSPKLGSNAAEGSIWFYLGAAFIGGMILNVMPCVLPVLAIKVLSFAQQAGESRSRVLALNVSYTTGVLAVFLTLATLAVGTQLGLGFVGDFSWGGLFQHTRFNLVMACIVFGMGLSLLGVFEIPVPGMVGSAAGHNQGEGLLGAFLTGIFATLLATPCTGPVMATALGWSIRQPPVVVYLVWGVMGLGMASPYLLLGFFPQLISWLPKPGTWMVRFKEFAGFLLVGSVIFIIYYTDKKFTIPLLVMLLGISVGLWMIGNLYDVNSHIRNKMTVRVTALALSALICWGGYSLAGQNKYSLDWQPFSETRIAGLLKQNRPVLVDFTADWCINCHVNEYVALNTKATQEFVNRHKVVALKADFTEQSAEIRRWLLKFKQDGVPLTVIFPPGQGGDPIVLDGVYTQGTLLESLRKAIGVESSSAQAPDNATAIR